MIIDHTLNVIQLWRYHILTYILEVHWITIYTEYEIWPLPDVVKLITYALMWVISFILCQARMRQGITIVMKFHLDTFFVLFYSIEAYYERICFTIHHVINSWAKQMSFLLVVITISTAVNKRFFSWLIIVRLSFKSLSQTEGILKIEWDLWRVAGAKKLWCL